MSGLFELQKDEKGVIFETTDPSTNLKPIKITFSFIKDFPT
jgi:hypothetical protein